jgi:hypothetical protein
VILLELIKGDVVESDAVEVEVREVFEMLDVVLVAVGSSVAVLPAAWILFCLQIICIILFQHSIRTRAFSCSFVCPIL